MPLPYERSSLQSVHQTEPSRLTQLLRRRPTKGRGARSFATTVSLAPCGHSRPITLPATPVGINSWNVCTEKRNASPSCTRRHRLPLERNLAHAVLVGYANGELAKVDCTIKHTTPQSADDLERLQLSFVVCSLPMNLVSSSLMHFLSSSSPSARSMSGLCHRSIVERAK